MKHTSIAALTVAVMANSAYAASDFIDTAQVVSSTPIIERVSEPREECDNAPAPRKSSDIVAPIIGGVIGGLIGHQVGQGRGRTAATIVGAAGGAVAGTAVNNRVASKTGQQCRTVESSREVVNGYDVVYRYNGRDVNVLLPYNPGAGSTIKVGVSMILDERAADSSQTGNVNGNANAQRSSSGYGRDYGDTPANRGRTYPR